MRKQETLQHWRAMPADQPILKHMDFIPYKAKGSRYGACGIRIDGNPAFVDAVLSHLKELLAGEAMSTRLELARSKVHKPENVAMGKSFENADQDAEVCYIRLHQRGREGAMAAAIFSRDGDQMDRNQKTLQEAWRA